MLNHLSLTELAARIRRRELSPVEAVDAYLGQVERHNPSINAFVLLLADEARRLARDAEQAVMRGGDLGPLHGVPVTVKDSLDMRGLPTACGSRLFQGLAAPRDSTVARRLQEAGAIILGKTNCPEFLMSYETDNFTTGRTNNPWDLERTPGGSSGGESSAIASFMSAGGVGSDGGGSVRIPAAFCGIAGLKPTPGRVPAAGHVPEISHPGGLLGVVGPMARTAEDVRALFRVLACYDFEDPFSTPMPLRAPRLDGLRIGVMEQFLDVPAQPAVRETVRRAAVCLESIGFAVDEFRPSGIERSPNLWWFFFGRVPSRGAQALINGHEDEVHWTGTEFLNKALKEPQPTFEMLVESLAERDRMRARMLDQMEAFPVILMPVCGVPAFRHRERRWLTPEKSIGLFEAMMPVTPWNLLGLPGMTIPFGMSEDGLPIGIQLVGQPYGEERLLDLAVRLEQARGPFAGPPGF
jgi:amidase